MILCQTTLPSDHNFDSLPDLKTEHLPILLCRISCINSDWRERILLTAMILVLT